VQTTSGSPIELPVGVRADLEAGPTEAGGKWAAASKGRTQATIGEVPADGPANRKLASVRADLEETETVTQAREQHAPRRATCDFEAALR
jgi:hypothetical protein